VALEAAASAVAAMASVAAAAGSDANDKNWQKGELLVRWELLQGEPEECLSARGFSRSSSGLRMEITLSLLALRCAGGPLSQPCASICPFFIDGCDP